MSPTRPAGAAARRAARGDADLGDAARGDAARGDAKGAPEDVSGTGDTTAPSPARRATPSRLDPDVLAGLEEERDFLLASLKDLEREHDAGDVDDVDYRTLKDEYTARAARVLRAIDEESTRYVEALAARPPRSRRRVVLTWLGVVLFAVVAGVGIAQASGRRLAGDQITGGIRAGSSDKLQQAQELFSQGEFEAAVRLYDEVLVTQPRNAEALTFRGWLLYLPTRGQERSEAVDATRNEALASIDEALAADPEFGAAKVFRVVILADLGRIDEARSALDALAPADVPQFMQPQLEALRTRLDPLANARSLAANGDLQGALRAYDEVLAADPTNVDALTEKAYLLIGVARQARDPETAATLRASASAALDEAAAVAPGDPSVTILRAVLYADQGRTVEARQLLDSVPPEQVPAALATVAGDLRERVGP